MTFDDAYAVRLDERAAFVRDGHVTLRGLLGARELAEVEPALSAEVARQNGLEGTAWDERTTYERAFVQVGNLWEHDAASRQLVFAKRLASAAAGLLGTDGVRLYHDQALYKEPTEGEAGHTPWHVDQYYWPLASDRSITAWIPLTPVPHEAGPLTFASGSQNFEGLRHLEISDESEARCREELTRHGFPAHAEPFEVGDVSFHLGWTYHGAPPNRSRSVRKAMTVIYLDADMTIAEPKNDHQRADLAKWFPGLQPGDRAASDRNPILFAGRGSDAR